MKLRFSFTVRIMLPYLVLAVLFAVIFLSEFNEGHDLVVWLSAGGVMVSLIMGILHNVWLKKPLKRLRDLIVKLTRGNIPLFNASKATDEIGDLERNLEKHVTNLRGIASFSRSMATGDFTGKFEKLSSEDEQILELFGSYTFDREKYHHRSFHFGEGLVGRSALEKEVIYHRPPS
jgi:HAMP domain-containing protein